VLRVCGIEIQALYLGLTKCVSECVSKGGVDKNIAQLAG